jgi:hypothetical protein
VPFLDAFVSGRNLRTLDAVADAIDGGAARSLDARIAFG